jgi:DNA-binding transcriptional LysR family regulator
MPPCAMDLSDLEALMRVAEHGTFQGAAATHRVTRSALRRHVERLERELGVPLLTRGASGIALTAAGETVVSHATPLLQQARALKDQARATRDAARGVLRLVVPVGLPPEPRSTALLGLRSLHPDLDIAVFESDDPLSRIREPFDLMFHFGDPPERHEWFSHVVARIPVGLRATPAYLKAHGRPSSLEDLPLHTLLQWTAPGLEDAGLPLKEGGTVRCAPWLRTANLPMLVGLAVAHAGLVFCPGPPVLGADATRVLVPVLDDVVGGRVTLRALSPRPGRVDPKVRALLKNAQRLMGGPGPA